MDAHYTKRAPVNTLITICNWDTYQDNEYMRGKACVKDALNPSQTDVKPALTNKNEKNEKKGKKGKPSSSFPLSFEEQDAQRAAAANADALTAFLKH